MPNWVIPGFDKWCRIKSGLSNAKIAKAVSSGGAHYSEDLVQAWREGAGVPDPDRTLAPLQVALAGPWPPATADAAWRDLQELIRTALEQEPTTAEVVLPAKKAVVLPEKPAKAAPARPRPVAAPVDPQLDALKKEIEKGTEQLAAAVTASEQVWLGWFSRTADKFKKYLLNRDLKHRKAYLGYCLQQADQLLEKVRGRRAELASQLEKLGASLQAFDTMQKQCADRMERKRDENVGLWRELKAAQPLVAAARAAHEKAAAKNLVALDDFDKRSQAFVADWKTRYDAIAEPASISLNWLTPESKLGQRLAERPPVNGDIDPFEGLCLCKDKLADHYKTPPKGGEKPVEIDLSCEIDLTVAGLEQRQRVARELSRG